MSLIERSKDLLITDKHIFDLAVNSAFSTGVTELIIYCIAICLAAFLKYSDTRTTGLATNLYNVFCVTVPLIIIATMLYLSIDSIDKILNPELRALQEITK